MYESGDSFEYYFTGIDLYERCEKYEEAIEYSDKAIIIFPDEKYIRYKVKALQKLKKYSDAIEYLDKSIEINPISKFFYD